MTNLLAGPSALRDIIRPQFHQNNFEEEKFVKHELGVKLDRGMTLLPAYNYDCSYAVGRRSNLPSRRFSWLSPRSPSLSSKTHATFGPKFSTPEATPHPSSGARTAGYGLQTLAAWSLVLVVREVWLLFRRRRMLVRAPEGKADRVPRLQQRILQARVACQLYLTGFCPLGSECARGHPKAELPPPKAYEPPEPPSHRELGPPPPGYGRYADVDRGMNGPMGPGAGGSGGLPGPRRNLEDVVCFKEIEAGLKDTGDTTIEPWTLTLNLIAVPVVPHLR
ncbi:hypothetical protein NLI96_g1357 [Meripilus lineatus]|uniref:C3H1-type domain-containing protein n=1 Tax=Meripilus lineatus TaxID=2056292 RepID=A0AAD5VAQ9_9APHY|nr:hypothetical protein NLI96_g1357 [Physisporinus lineatus]